MFAGEILIWPGAASGISSIRSAIILSPSCKTKMLGELFYFVLRDGIFADGGLDAEKVDHHDPHIESQE